MKKEILKFHYEEIVYVLLILVTNLKDYSEENLKSFAEAIHRLDTLSKQEFIKELKLINPKIDDDFISNLIELQKIISELYSGQWYKTLTKNSSVMDKSFLLSRQLLDKLSEKYIEPIKYAENNMDVNWQRAPKTSTSLLKTGTQWSKHSLQRLAERGVTKDMAEMAISKGQKFYDPLNKSINYVLPNGYASGKSLLVGTNPLTGEVTTVILSSKNLINKRFVPIK